MMIQIAEQDLLKEETYDNNMRASHGAQWTIMASTGLNQPYKSNIGMYR
jgi:hypothetical protein